MSTAESNTPKAEEWWYTKVVSRLSLALWSQWSNYLFIFFRIFTFILFFLNIFFSYLVYPFYTQINLKTNFTYCSFPICLVFKKLLFLDEEQRQRMLPLALNQNSCGFSSNYSLLLAMSITISLSNGHRFSVFCPKSNIKVHSEYNTVFCFHCRLNILGSGTGPMRRDKLASRTPAGMDGQK